MPTAHALLPRSPLLAGLVAALLLTPGCAAASPGVTVTVVSVGDGDTIRVRRGGALLTVRLACIDAPETAQAPHGAQSRRYLQQRLPQGHSVRLDQQSTDRYGRSVAEVHAGTNLNLALVEAGHAFVYHQYLSRCDRVPYLQAEERARRCGLGVWQQDGGITRPWDFRRQRSASSGQRRYRCSEIGSFARAQDLLRQGHTYLDGNGDGIACESLR